MTCGYRGELYVTQWSSAQGMWHDSAIILYYGPANYGMNFSSITLPLKESTKMHKMWKGEGVEKQLDLSQRS